MARTKGSMNKPRRKTLTEFFARSFVCRRAFEALCAYPYGRTMKQLIEEVYRGAIEPDWASSSLQVSLCLFNRKAKQHRWGVRIHGHRGPGSKYQVFIVREC